MDGWMDGWMDRRTGGGRTVGGGVNKFISEVFISLGTFFVD